MNLAIRELKPHDKTQWLELWDGYLNFYQQELSEAQTELSWQRLLHAKDGLHAIVAEHDAKLVGLAHYFWTPSTWQENKDIYLEDLYVSPSTRGRGVGTGLIETLVDICLKAGGSRVHWQTHRSNKTAIALYEKLAKKSEFIVFEAKAI